MSSSVRIDNSKFYISSGVTSDENSVGHNIKGADKVSIVVSIADNGSGAGTVALEGCNDDSKYVEITDSSQTIDFTASAQNIIFDIIDPSYLWIRIAVTVSAGDMDFTGEITVIEGHF